MALAHRNLGLGRLGAVACICGTLWLGGCANIPGDRTFAFGGVDPASPLAGEVAEASRSPGRYPKLNQIPPLPTDVRPVSAWKAAVVSEWARKDQLEASTAAIPFTLSHTDEYASSARSRISSVMALQAPADAEARTEAFAAAERARATPPPKAN
jgi:hypothetical protein